MSTGDLPEGQQSANVGSSWCSTVEGCHWASHMRGGASLYVKICTLCKRIDWDDLAEQVARVRADVAGAITADLQAARRAAAAPASMESLDRALRIVARHAVAPAESVVGAPTPAAAPSDLAEVEYGLRRDGYVARYDSREKAECWAAESLPDWELVSRRVGVWESAPPVGALPEDEGTRQEGLINVEE